MRENALCALLAGSASVVMGWLGLYGYAWNDYEVEAQPAFDALTHGHVLAFLRLAPAYGGSLVERAPFALLPGLWGGGQLAVYRMVAVPCLLAGTVLGVWLVAQMRSAERSLIWQAVALGICVANPLTLQALEIGHPEELLGACLCVAAVLLAGRGRPIWAGVLLGLAIANKEWALLAVGPVLLATPIGARGSSNVKGFSRAGWSLRGQTIVCLASAGTIAAVVLSPLILVGSGGFVSNVGAAAAPTGSTIFKPWQLWWFFGHHSALALGPGDVHNRSYRVGPAWASVVSHPLILAVGFGLASVLWLVQRRRGKHDATRFASDALLLLALVLLLRCLLDTWDESYYLLPFVLTLLAWELSSSTCRPPMLALVATVLAWASFQWLPAHGASPDAQAALFLAWTLPLGTMLALRLYAPRSATELFEAPANRTPVLGETRSSHHWATSI